MRLGTRPVWKRFDDLERHELYALLRLRNDVFVVEQKCPYPDIDGKDAEAVHLLAWAHADAAPLSGYLRIFAPNPDGGAAKIGRVVTAFAARGQGLGRQMMGEAITEIGRRFGACGIEISAQIGSERFYAGLGFSRISENYDEDGIAHCDMRYTPGAA